MNNPTIFRVINRSDNEIKQFRNARTLSIWFLGRRVPNYIVIKSDDTGDRLITFDGCEVTKLEEALTLA